MGGYPGGPHYRQGICIKEEGDYLAADIKNTRIYDFGNDFEAIYYRLGWGHTSNTEQKFKRSPRGCSSDYERNRKRNIQKARSKIRRIIKSYNLDRFVSLTFAENQQNIKEADHEFRKFMKRLARRFKDLKYVGVREFQDRGAVHYHLAVNQYIKQKQLAELWGQGFVWIEKKTNGQDHLINYLCKYLTKDAGDERLKGLHLYFCSQGLKISYEDKYFNSSNGMFEYLEETHGQKLKGKRILHFQEGQVIWIG